MDNLNLLCYSNGLVYLFIYWCANWTEHSMTDYFVVTESEMGWFSRPNPEDRIIKKTNYQKNDHSTKKSKNHKTKLYCFEPNIRPNLHLVNFNVLIEIVKGYNTSFIYLINIRSYGFSFIQSSSINLMSLSQQLNPFSNQFLFIKREIC